MPRYKGSCGCYNRQDARELGLAAAIVWNDMLDRSEHFDVNPMWYDQKSASERLGIPERSMNRAVERLVEAGRITKKRGYRPGTTTQTTWVTINAEADDSVGGFRNDDLAVSRNDDLAVSILKETKERDSVEKPPVVRVEKWDFDSKGNWKRKRTVYTTIDEADKIEAAEKDEYVQFGFWPSPTLVGHSDKMKTMSEKKTKLKTEYPDEPSGEDDKLKHFLKVTDM